MFNLVLFLVLIILKTIQGNFINHFGSSFQSIQWTTVPACPSVCNQLNWQNVNAANAVDNNAAQCLNVKLNEYSQQFQAMGFNFSISSNANIDGVVVSYYRMSQNTAKDFSVLLLLNGVLMPSSERCPSSCGTPWSNTYTNDTFGSPSDTWGLSLAPNDVNNPNFGVALVAYYPPPNVGGANYFIDAVSVTVYYSFGTPNSQNSGSSEAVAAAVVIIVLLLLIAGIIITCFYIRKNRPELLEKLNFGRHFGHQNSQKNSPLPPIQTSFDNTTNSPQDPPSCDTNIHPSNANESSSNQSTPVSIPPSQYWNSSTTNNNINSQTPIQPSPSPIQKTPSSSFNQKQNLPQAQAKQTPLWNPSVSNTKTSSESFIQDSPSLEETSPSPPSSIKSSKLPVKAIYRNSPNNYAPNIVFGIPLEHARKINGVPSPVELSIQWLEQNSLMEPGILRVSGSSTEIKNIKQTFDSGQDVDPSTLSNDPHVISGLLKLYFRDLPQVPLLMTQGLKEIADCEDPSQCLENLSQELSQIPKVNYSLLQRLFGYLCLVAQNEPSNKMTPENIGIVFGPTLKLPINLIATMVYYYNNIFS